MAGIVAISGVKNSGKTTLINRLTKELSDSGWKVAVIKHDGHDFDCDIPETDTYRFMRNGAYGTACISANRVFVHKTQELPGIEELIAAFPEADILFLEGFKKSRFPKIEVIREGISSEPVSNPEGRFLIVTDLDKAMFNERCCGFGDTEDIIRLIREAIHAQ